VSGYLSLAPIEKIDPGGNVLPFATGLSNARQIAFDKSGNLYVCNANGTIYKIDPSGDTSVFVTGTFEGLAFDNSGNLFTVNWWNGDIEKIDPSGQVSVFASSGFGFPGGLTFDSSGNLYVINSGAQPYTGSIEEFDPSGNGTIVATGLEFPESFAMLPIPEPATWALLALGALALLGGRRLRRC